MYEIGSLAFQLVIILIIGMIVTDIFFESVDHRLGKQKFRYARFSILFLGLLAAIFILISIETERESAPAVLLAKLLCLSIGVACRVGVHKRYKKYL